MKIPVWYQRYYSWARSTGLKRISTVSAIGGVGIAMLVMTLSTVFLSRQAALSLMLDVLGWLMLLGLPTAGLDAWAGGLMSGQKILPWVRLVLLVGGGVVGGAYLLLNY